MMEALANRIARGFGSYDLAEARSVSVACFSVNNTSETTFAYRMMHVNRHKVAPPGLVFIGYRSF
jgi:hypothetical protein